MKIYCLCDYPQAGQVKPELAAVIGEENAADVYEKIIYQMFRLADFVQDPFEMVFTVRGGTEKEWQDLLPGQTIIQYNEQDRTAQLNHLVTEHFSTSQEPMAIVVSDCLGIDSTTLQYASNDLQDRDLVLGPLSDGGAYLVAMKKEHCGLLDYWENEYALQDMMNFCYEADLSPAILDIKDDIDCFEDLPDVWKASYQKEITGRKKYEKLKQDGKISAAVSELSKPAGHQHGSCGHSHH